MTTATQPAKRNARTKVENWAGYDIRFVEVNGEWWAVLSDIANALDLKPKFIKQRLDDEVVSNNPLKDSRGKVQNMLIVNEFGIYDAIFSSRKPEAKEFKRWVFNIIKQLRESTGLEGFEVFRMLDKEHQKQAMQKLSQGLKNPKPLDHIKANSIANKAVSNMYGLPKMIRKSEMTPDMLKERQPILNDTVSLMEVNDKFDLGISVSSAVYKKTELNQ